MKSFSTAIFLLLISSFAFGGEWHSAGNAPPIPHFPRGLTAYKCTLTGYSWVGKKAYRFIQERTFEDRDFRGRSPSVYMELANTGDPGMDGQAMWLGFKLNAVTDEESLQLGVVAKIKNKGKATGRYEVLRSAKVITGKQEFSIDKPSRGGAQTVSVQVECRELN